MDLSFNPTESYLLIQDFLILTCAPLYALCYFFYKFYNCAGTPLYMCTTMAYELYYTLVMTPAEATPLARFERCVSLLWFAIDVRECVSAGAVEDGGFIGCGDDRREECVRVAGDVWPDERKQLTAYQTAIVLQAPISWGLLILPCLFSGGDTKGQSLEIG